MIEQSTLYTLGFVIVVIIALQYMSFIILRKMVKSEIGKVTRYLIKENKNLNLNNRNDKIDNKENKEDNEESLDIDTPTNNNDNNDNNNDIDSYVNPLPSVDNNEEK